MLLGIAGKLKKMTGGLATILLGAKYISSYKKNPVRRDTVFYAAHQGAGMLCGPYAIFRELMRSEDFRQYRHIWQINDKRERALLQKEYADYDNGSFVGKNSAGYFRAISSAGYLVINNTLPFFFTKKPGQVYVNTWHGIPLKTLGYDIPDGKYTARNMTRNFLQTDYLISPCPFMTKIYLESYKLNGIYTGKIIESGYPRNDLLLDTKREDVLRRLSERGTAVDYGDRRHVFISGTASINNKGEVVHTGNIVKQTERMLENVEVLLREADCSFADVGQMSVYLRDTADYHVVNRIFAERFPDTPYVIVYAPVCRPGWLIEMECMAVKAIDGNTFEVF